MASISVPFGDRIKFYINVVDQDGNPVDITNASLAWSVRESNGDGTILLNATTTGGEITKPDAINGVALVDIASAGIIAYGTRYEHEAKYRLAGEEPEQLWFDYMYVTDSMIGDNV